MTTYKDAGINIEATDAMIEDISSFSKKTSRIGAMNEIGGFAGIFDLKKCEYTDPLLITSTDGIGTKILLGIETRLLDGLGYDLVSMILSVMEQILFSFWITMLLLKLIKYHFFKW